MMMSERNAYKKYINIQSKFFSYQAVDEFKYFIERYTTFKQISMKTLKRGRKTPCIHDN